MKVLNSIAFCLLIILPVFSSGGIEFRDLTISQALELASKENKIVLVDFYADACPPCKYMENNVFNDRKLGELVNSNFIAIRSHSGNIEGKKEQAKYRIDMLPTILLIDPVKGELLRLKGKKELAAVMSILEDALKGDFSNGDKPLPKNDVPPVRPKAIIKDDLN